MKYFFRAIEDNNQINKILRIHPLSQDINITKDTVFQVFVVLRIFEGSLQTKKGAKAPFKSCSYKKDVLKIQPKNKVDIFVL